MEFLEPHRNKQACSWGKRDIGPDGHSERKEARNAYYGPGRGELSYSDNPFHPSWLKTVGEEWKCSKLTFSWPYTSLYTVSVWVLQQNCLVSPSHIIDSMLWVVKWCSYSHQLARGSYIVLLFHNRFLFKIHIAMNDRSKQDEF